MVISCYRMEILEAAETITIIPLLMVGFSGYNLLYLPFSKFDFTHCNVWGGHFVSRASYQSLMYQF